MTRVVFGLIVALLSSLVVSPVSAADNRDPSWRTGGDVRACSAPRWPADIPASGPGAGRRVVVIGDSLTRESQTMLERYLRASGWNPTIRCFGGKRLDWAIDQVRDQRTWRGLPDQVIISMGTNDMRWIDRTVTKSRIHKLLEILGPRRDVMWVNLYGGNGDRFTKDKQRWFNRTVGSFATKYPNLRILEWDSIAAREGVVLADALHYTKSGYRLRARETVALLNSLFGSVRP